MVPNEDGKKTMMDRKTLFDDVHMWIDTHLKLIQNGIYAVGGIGVILMARRIHLTSVFARIEDVPYNVIKRQFHLHGVVKSVSNEGVLYIEHKPMMRIPFTKQISVAPLRVHLACLEVSPAGHQWLDQTVNQKTVWFQILHRTSYHGHQRLYSNITVPRMLYPSVRVNEELVKQGLCRISCEGPFYETEMLTNKTVLKYLDKLVKLESKASKKEIGIWTNPKKQERKQKIRKGFELIKNGFLSVGGVLSWFGQIFKRRKN